MQISGSRERARRSASGSEQRCRSKAPVVGASFFYAIVTGKRCVGRKGLRDRRLQRVRARLSCAGNAGRTKAHFSPFRAHCFCFVCRDRLFAKPASSTLVRFTARLQKVAQRGPHARASISCHYVIAPRRVIEFRRAGRVCACTGHRGEGVGATE